MLEFLNQLDTDLFILLNGLHNDFWDGFFLWATEKFSWIWLYVIILLLLIRRYLEAGIVRKTGSSKSGTGDSGRNISGIFMPGIRLKVQTSNWPWFLLVVVFIVFLIALSDQVSVHLFKEIFQRLRPSHEPDLFEFIHLPRRKGGLYGFVSSHAANSFAIAYFTSGIIGLKWYTWLIFFWAVIFSYSRIYIGVHYPGDSIAGAAVGLFLGWMVLRVWASAGRAWFPQLLPGRLRGEP